MDRKSDAASIGHDLYVSDYHHCDARSAEYDRVIHIWRHSQGHERCQQTLQPRANGLSIVWTELESFSRMSVLVVPHLRDFVEPPGRILLHCQAGMGRAPCLAMLCKVIRGCDPWTAIADIQRANWQTRGIPFGMWGRAIDEAVAFWETTK